MFGLGWMLRAFASGRASSRRGVGSRRGRSAARSLALSGIALATCLLLPAASALAVTVTFPDPALEQSVRDALSKTSGETITDIDMQSLTSLDGAYQSGICDLAGLEYATNLKWLWLSGQQITTLTPLAGLTKLTQLDLSNNPVGDISALSGLTQLRYLDLDQTEITTLTPLAGLPNLHTVSLAGNHISDLSALGPAHALWSLDVSGNQITDLSPLQGHTALFSLRANGNLIATTTPVASMTGLRDLYLSGNQVSDLSAVATPPSLRTLDVSGNQVTSIAPVAGMTNVQQLYLGSNQISSIAPVAGLTKLTTLQVESNNITSIAPLSGLANLVNLHLEGNQIADLTPLQYLSNLWQVVLTDNRVADISPLMGLPSLSNVFLATNCLDLSEGSGDMNAINTMMAAGKFVEFDPQRTVTVTPSAGEHGTVSPASAQTLWYGSNSATLTITPDSGYGVSDVTIDGVSVGPLTEYRFANVAADHVMHAEFSAISDTAAPVTTDDAPAGWVAGPTLVSLTATDTGSGVAVTYYSLDGSTPSTPYNGMPIVVAGQGVTYLRYYSVDAAGNAESISTREIRTDSYPPITSDDAPSGWACNPVVLTFTPADSLSGVGATYYSINNSVSCIATAGMATVSVEGTTQVSYWSVDLAGNVEATKTATVRIDTVAPITTSNTPTSVQARDTTVTLSPADSRSGVERTYYRIGGGAVTTYTAPFVVSQEGTTPLTFWSLDVAGNREATKTATIKIDKTSPSIRGTITYLGVPPTRTLVRILDARYSYKKLVKSVTADTSGFYSAFVPRGNYLLIFEPSESLLTQYYDHGDQSVRAQATPVSTAGGPVVVSSDLAPIIKGTVTNRGVPLANVLVTAYDAVTHMSVEHAYTDASGAYAIRVSAGRYSGYHIRFDSQAESLDQYYNHGLSVSDATTVSAWGMHNLVADASADIGQPTVVGVLTSQSAALAGVGVDVLDADTHDLVGTTTTNPWGAYAIPVGVGAYHVKFNVPSNPALTQYFDHKFAVSDATTVTAAGGLVAASGDLSPTLSDDAPTEWTPGPVTVTLSSSDPGVAALRYSVNGSDATTYVAGIPVSAQGTNTVQYAAVDSAGAAESTRTATVRIDNDAPTSSDDASSGWVNGPLHLTSTDVLSGVAGVRYTVNGSDPATYTSGISVAGGSAASIEYAGVDNAGNSEATHTILVSLDVDAPETTSGAMPFYAQSAALSLTAEDSQSGVAATYWRLDGGAWTSGLSVSTAATGTHTVQYYSIDRLGNTEPVKTVSFGVGCVVSIPDANLEAAIRSALSKPNGDITDFDMRSMTALHADSRGIGDLTGLEYATNLRMVWLGNNQIVDVSPLAHLPLLDAYLELNLISDLTPLVGQTRMRGLLLQYNHLDLTPGSQAMDVISQLTAAGVFVWSGPQRLANLSCSVGPNGAISPDCEDGYYGAYFGTSITVTITPDDGYRVADVVVDGTSVGPTSTYVFDNVQTDHWIRATFEPVTP